MMCAARWRGWRGYRRERLGNVKCVCITGSVGKTTTKDMAALVLSAHRPTYATAGNMNSRIGLPLSVLRVPEEARACVLEIGMSEPGEIAPLSEAAAPDIAVVTNIGSSHIQAFGSREGICLEKMSIVNGLRPGGTLVLNGDEPLLTAAAATCAAAVCVCIGRGTSRAVSRRIRHGIRRRDALQRRFRRRTD